ncbi:KpsF/GutQ family sugar-phosphate isomerase [Thiohalorhabdus sp.]|uniref:KpsF/GutQ family sugar-phosphate isomerase n=1 Tax=Thiohalorhabdus sp. TaxID=3094134 RepID=UPI002FC3A14C
MSRVLDNARRTLTVEAAALQEAEARLEGAFEEAVQIILASKGRLVVTGMGKSGLIGRKIAATLASTGTPSFFMHPAEGSHGDLGMITGQDVVLTISSSGETQEVVALLPLLQRLGTKVIAMVGRADSTLGQRSDAILDISVTNEACPMNLAPTASTTVTLALGDALAVSLLEERGFTPEDFARFHPGGSLGKQLLLHISDLMHSGDGIPQVRRSAPMREALLEMTAKRLGMTAVVDAQERLVGVITDGDLRRSLDEAMDLHEVTAGEAMTPDPFTIGPDELAARGLQYMEDRSINGLLVVAEGNRVVGALNMHDFLRAGVI